MRWSYWTYPRLTLHINTLSRSSITLNRRRENLDVRIQSKGKEPETTKQRENPRRVDLGHPIEVVRKYFLEQRLSYEEQQKWVTKMFGYDFKIIYKKREAECGGRCTLKKG